MSKKVFIPSLLAILLLCACNEKLNAEQEKDLAFQINKQYMSCAGAARVGVTVDGCPEKLQQLCSEAKGKEGVLSRGLVRSQCASPLAQPD